MGLSSHTSPLSRVYAYDWFGSLVFIPIGQTLAGPVAAAVGVRETIAGSGLVVLVAILCALTVPSVRNLRAPAAEKKALAI